ncbi:hypothetical protein [Bacteroides sp.]|uniref:hypothetical protein n=1 Tax=Bacteroides sp. TaxID=29523 RepID=UPI0023C8E43F|nr:hypothetical protein [Bacteroides sp.]MDE6215175.1 hypothetical protein [Bacteroides sp.]
MNLTKSDTSTSTKNGSQKPVKKTNFPTEDTLPNRGILLEEEPIRKQKSPLFAKKQQSFQRIPKKVVTFIKSKTKLVQRH